MSVRIRDAFELGATPEDVAGVLVTEAFQLELEKGRDGVLDARFEMVSEDDREAVMRVRTTEYRRTKTGGFDRSATTEQVTEHRVDKTRPHYRWSFKASDRFQFHGEYTITPTATGCRVNHDVDIDIRIPIIGKQIAKVVAREFEKAFPRYREVMRSHLSRRQS